METRVENTGRASFNKHSQPATRPVSFAHVIIVIEPPLSIPGDANNVSLISARAMICNFGHRSRSQGRL
jgi:hypothetical protein